MILLFIAYGIDLSNDLWEISKSKYSRTDILRHVHDVPSNAAIPFDLTHPK
jgi:hypothetical protein